MSYHFHSSLYRITKAVRIQPCHSWVSKKRLSYFLAAFPESHWFLSMGLYYEGGAVIAHKARLLIACGGRGWREHPPLPYIQSNACRFLFLLFSYLRFAEAASFDKKELRRSYTSVYTYRVFNMNNLNCTGPIRDRTGQPMQLLLCSIKQLYSTLELIWRVL